MRRNYTTVRCPICDWSPSNNKSLFNPEIEEIETNRLVTTDNGEEICHECFVYIKAQNKDFKKFDETTRVSRYILDRDHHKVLAMIDGYDVDKLQRVKGFRPLRNGGWQKKANFSS